ncbi:MAG: translational GTPase TypA [Bacteroidales bacterium]|nr:translational GTPase TypA [Bacteroidales bacterium]
MPRDAKKIRNVGIIAHVDHGKTTLVDTLFRQCSVKVRKDMPTERIMDRNDLERERGITIFSKCASVNYKDYLVNIVDTPGHSDFGGEVERILNMVDGVLLLVDAVDGPMPQTKFVLRKALKQGLHPIVVINKMDRPHARARFVENAIFDLFVSLGATDEQLDFPIVYASAKDGWATMTPDKKAEDVVELLDLILSYVPPPVISRTGGFSMLISNISYNSYVGQLAHGRVYSGTIKQNSPIYLLKKDNFIQPCKVLKILSYEGLEQVEAMETSAGEIVAIAGAENLEIGDTLAMSPDIAPLPRIRVDEPTISMFFYTNSSPFFGSDGKYVTSRKIRERLQVEVMGNVAICVEDGDSPDSFKVSGRGELQLSILIETMRREGYELEISQPKVILREIDGKIHEPFEELVLDVENTFLGAVMENLGKRKSEVLSLHNDGVTTRVELKIPARGLFGFHSEYLSLTKGTGLINQSFYGYELFRGAFPKNRRGVMVSMEAGRVSTYALTQLKDRGTFFVRPGEKVYEGMIVGEHCRDNDLPVNICKEKHLTNMRSSTSEIVEKLPAPRDFSLEQCMEYIEDDELVEVTPVTIRMRKKTLNHDQRQRQNKKKTEDS